jgi:hypothetical protein
MAKRDVQLVKLLVDHLNSYSKSDYNLTALPEETNRTTKAVEAIATDSKGNTIAFEHTLIQPFVGDKSDAQPLLKAFAPVEDDPNCILKGYHVQILVPVGAVRKGVDWKQLADELANWLRRQKEALREGESEQTFSALQPELTISIVKTLTGLPGMVSVGRYGMPEDFSQVIRTALRTKWSKIIIPLTYYVDKHRGPEAC